MSRKTRITSKVNKDNFLQAIEDIRRECTDRDVIEKLNKIKDCLQKQEPSTLKSVLDLDLNIGTLLDDLKKDIEKNSDGVTQIRLRKVDACIKNRDKLCPHSVIGFSKQQIKNQKIADKVNLNLQKKRERRIRKGLSVADLYTNEELAELMLERVYDECLDYEGQAQQWLSKYNKNKNDTRAFNRFKQLETKINIANQRIRFLENEANRTIVIDQVSSFKDEYKDMLAKRKVSNDQFKILMNDFSGIKDEIDVDIDIVDDAMSTINEMGTSGGRVKKAGDNSNTYGGFMGEAAATSSMTNSGMDNYLKNSPLAQKLGGVTDEREEAVKETLENIEAIIATLWNCSAQFEKDKIKCDAEIKRCEDQLLSLKPEYLKANASEKISIADQIKTINTPRVANIKNRDRIIRAKDQLNKQIEMAMGMKGIKDITLAKKRASDVMGRKFDLETWAMFIKGFDKNENSLLDEFETYLDVANSETVNHTAMPENDAPYQSELTVDEHLFDALWDEIEKKRNEGNE